MQALLPILRHPKEPNYERLSEKELNEMIENYDEQLHHGERINEAKNSFNKKFEKAFFTIRLQFLCMTGL